MFTKDELWTLNMPHAWLKNYLQLDSQELVQLNDEENKDEELDSDEEIALQV